GDGASLFSTEETPAPRALIGDRYRPIEKIGHGGMGSVWRAEDTFIKRAVALKLMKVPKSADPEEMRLRMRREVIIAGRLSHPHVVTVYDAGLEGRDVFLVMELISGPTLAEALKADGAFEPARAVAICQQILDALSLAHREGFIHRDLKPSNVLMVGPDVVKVADFGLAKLLRDVDGSPQLLKKELTQPEYAVGTPPYMAPEQLRCEAVDGRADLYAVGLLLFEMVHGAALSRFQKPLARARAVTESRFDQPIPVFEDEPRIHAVLTKALAVRPAERYPDAETFARALDGARSSWQKHLPRPFPRRGPG
ncbi:MAG: serine/threonine-protein kinase, partial [Acidobacteriota bacterium]